MLFFACILATLLIRKISSIKLISNLLIFSCSSHSLLPFSSHFNILLVKGQPPSSAFSMFLLLIKLSSFRQPYLHEDSSSRLLIYDCIVKTTSLMLYS